MARPTTLTEEEKEKILELYREVPNFTRIAEMIGVPYYKVRSFLRTMEKTSLKVINRDEILAKKDIEQSFDAYSTLMKKIDEIEGFLTQMKKDDGKIDLSKSKDYLVAWNSITSTLQWWIDKKLKLQEMMNTQIFRDSILEVIEKEFPSTARRIREIIQEKSRELGMF